MPLVAAILVSPIARRVLFFTGSSDTCIACRKIISFPPIQVSGLPVSFHRYKYRSYQCFSLRYKYRSYQFFPPIQVSELPVFPSDTLPELPVFPSDTLPELPVRYITGASCQLFITFYQPKGNKQLLVSIPNTKNNGHLTQARNFF